MTATAIFELLKQTYTEWNEDKAPRLGAALAYYTVFSIAPLLVIIIALIGIFFGEEAARGEISAQIARVVGSDAAEFIETMVAGANKPGSGGIVATVIGGVTLLMGAMGVFGQLQDALNTIWEVPPAPKQPFLQVVKARLMPFTMVIGIAFLLLASLAVSAAISALGAWMQHLLPLPAWVMQAVNFGVGFLIVTLLFALIYKVLPDAEIQWRDVWIGAAITTVLFLLGQLALSWYVGKTAASSTYGAAGSLVAVLLWVYWTAQILFFGAEFTQVYANKYGSKLLPAGELPATEAKHAARNLAQTKDKPGYRNLLAEARREEDSQNQSQETKQQKAQRELVEDVGSILAGIGIILILKRVFTRKEKTS